MLQLRGECVDHDYKETAFLLQQVVETGSSNMLARTGQYEGMETCDFFVIQVILLDAEGRENGPEEANDHAGEVEIYAIEERTTSQKEEEISSPVEVYQTSLEEEEAMGDQTEVGAKVDLQVKMIQEQMVVGAWKTSHFSIKINQAQHIIYTKFFQKIDLIILRNTFAL